MRLCSLILIILFTGLSFSMIGQNVMSGLIKEDSLVHFEDIVDKDSLLNQILNLSGFEQVKFEVLSSLKNLTPINQLDKLNGMIEKVKGIKKMYQSTLLNVSYYGTNQRDSFSIVNSFLNANAAFNVKIMDIPLSVQTSMVLENGHLRTDFSYTNIHFDFAQYSEALREKVSMITLKEHFRVEQLTQRLNFNKIDADAVMQDAKFNIYNSVISHPKVLALRSDINNKIDSLKTQGDSLIASKTQLYLDSLLSMKKKFEQFYEVYETLWEKKKQLFYQLENLKTKLSTAENDIKSLSDLNTLKAKALSDKRLNVKDKLMLNTKGLETGQFGVDENDFTFKNQVLNGFKYEYEGKRKQFGIIIGRSRFRALETPVLYNPFQRTTLGRQFTFLKYGVNMADSSQVIFSLLNVHKSRDTLFRGLLTPDYNTVLAVTYEKKIIKKFSILTDIALSNVRQTFSSDIEKPSKIQDDLAASTALFYTHNDALKCGIGYFYVGNHFITYGNDFLLNNRNGLKIDAQWSGFKSKLTLKMGVKSGFMNDPSVLGLSQSIITQISGGLDWRVFKHGSIQFQYMPNTITQITNNPNDRRGYDYRSNIYVLSGIFNYNILKKAQSAFVTVSNLNQYVDFFDSVRTSQSMFFNFRHQSHITTTSSFVLSSNIGFNDNYNAVNTGLVQLDFRAQVNKKWGIIVGAQQVKRLTDVSWRWGSVSNISINLNKNIRFKGGIIYRTKPENSLNNQNEWIANTSLTMQF